MKTIVSSDTQKEIRVPPGQKVTEKWPVLQYGGVHHIDPAEWKFTLTGLVEKEKTLNFQEFMALPRVEVISDIHCVTGWSKLENVWEGVSTSTFKEIVTPLPEAAFVMVHAVQNFTTNLSFADFFAEDVLFAVAHNGTPLTPEHGYPVRLIVPRLYFWKSAKWVTGVEFMAEDKRGFWESHGYHNRGNPWKEERYSSL